MRTISLVLLAVFTAGLLATGCRSASNGRISAASNGPGNHLGVTLTEAQQKWVGKYDRFKEKIFRHFGLRESASWEDARPLLAKAIGFTEKASWDDLLKSPVVTNELTERKRVDIARDFGLGDKATWFEIRDALESAGKFAGRRTSL